LEKSGGDVSGSRKKIQTPKSLSPASPNPGTMNPFPFNFWSMAAVKIGNRG
jgi:hypothetical protein